MKRKNSNKKHVVYAIILLLAAAAAVLSLNGFETPRTQRFVLPTQQDLPQLPEYHVHADFKVFINGRQADFSKLRYDFVNPVIHLHVRNFAGDRVIHIESQDATLRTFFSSLDMSFSKSCFSIDATKYCNNSTHTIKFLVNGVENNEYEIYRPKDADRILVSYGSEKNLTEQMGYVTNLACVFSGKCPLPQDAVGRIFYN